MHFGVEILSSDGDLIQGTVLADGGDQPVPFFGWLELLRLLEPRGSSSPPLEFRRAPTGSGATSSPTSLTEPTGESRR